MESKSLNLVQIILLVNRYLSEKRYAELGRLARQDKRIFDQLVTVLNSGKRPLCYYAATSLSKVGGAAVAPLIAALHDNQHPLRQVAALALGEIGDREAIPDLISTLQDTNPAVRQAAVVALEKIGAEEASPAMLQCLHDESVMVRKCVVTALGIIGDQEAIPLLKGLIEQDTQDIALSAHKAIRNILKRKNA